jgi:hypothetical protein
MQIVNLICVLSEGIRMLKNFVRWIRLKFISQGEVGKILVSKHNKWEWVDANHPKNNPDVIINNTRPLH